MKSPGEDNLPYAATSPLSPRKKVLLFGILVLFPLLWFALFSFRLVKMTETAFKNKKSLELEQRLFTLHYQMKPVIFCGSRLKEFTRWYENTPKAVSSLPDLLRKLQRRWRFQFEPYVFDSEGTLVTPREIPLLYRFAMQNLWKRLNEKTAFGKSLPRKEQKVFEALFGASFNISDWREAEQTVLDFRFSGKDGFLFWKRVKSPHSGGQILVIRNIPNPRNIFSALDKLLVREHLFLLFRDGKNRLHRYGLPLGGGLADQVKIMELSKAKEHVSPSFLMRRKEVGEGVLFLGQSFPMSTFWLYQKLLPALAVCLFLLSGIVFRIVAQAGSFVSLSIKFKLVFLFLYSLAVCSAGTAFLGFQLLDDRRDVLRKEAERSAREDLNALDLRFAVARREFSEWFRTVRERIMSARDPVASEQYLQNLVGKKQLMHFEIRNLQGNLVIPKEQPASFENLSHFLDAFAKTAISQTLGSRLRLPEGAGFTPPDSKTGELFEGADLGFAGILAAPNTAHPVNISENEFLWYWDTNREPGHPNAFITLLQSLMQTKCAFLEANLPAGLRPEDTGIFRFVLSRDAKLRFPKDLPMGKSFIALLEMISQTGKPVLSTVKLHGKDFLIIGQPGKNLRNFFLFALIGESDIEKSVNMLKNGVFLCLGSGLFVALFIGLLLSDHFLKPIGELSGGMRALQRRDVTYRVPVWSPDEFGDLAQSFNLMIEDLREMELAKIVQKSLIPESLPAIPGYQLVLKNLVATDLGGDYCDILPLPSNRFLLVIGDVTGHGVRAALGMAVAKAITFQFAREDGEPDALLQRLSHIFFQAFNKWRNMTFFAGILSPESGIIRFSNAGHLSPLLCRPGEEIQELVHINFPLGIRPKKVRYTTMEMVLKPGQSLFFFTDGLMEGFNQNSEQFGFKAILRALKQESLAPPEKTLERLLETFRAFTGTDELDDDLTMMILRRKDVGE